MQTPNTSTPTISTTKMYPSSVGVGGGGDQHKYGYSTAAMNITQGRPYIGGGPDGGRWSTGLCHCCDDPANCVVTCLCPCITFGQISEIVNQGQTGCGVTGTIYGLLMGFTGLACLYSCVYRSRMRAQYDLEEAPSADCLVHFCCEPCALCQEYRELKSRGYDISIGWDANMERRNRGIVTPPLVGGMHR